MHWKVISLESVDSTQDYTKMHCSQWQQEFVCVYAKEQTKAYGTRGKAWHAPRGNNIYASLYFPWARGASSHLLAQLMAYTAIQVVRQQNLTLQIKWPNDLLIGGKKCGGILVELIPRGALWDVVLGLGLNLALSLQDLAKIDQPATSLEEASKKRWNREELLHDLLLQFREHLRILKEKGGVWLQKNLSQHLLGLGKPCLFSNEKSSYQGIFQGVSSEGALELKESDGRVRSFFSGSLKKIDRSDYELR